MFRIIQIVNSICLIVKSNLGDLLKLASTMNLNNRKDAGIQIIKSASIILHLIDDKELFYTLYLK